MTAKIQGIKINEIMYLDIEEIKLINKIFKKDEIKVVEEENLYRILTNDVDIVLKIINEDGTALISLNGLSTDGAFDSNPFNAKIIIKDNIEKVTALTIYRIGRDYAKGFEIYGPIGIERAQPPPTEPKIKYPDEPIEDPMKIDCWSYPYITDNIEKIYPYTMFLIARTSRGYSSIITFSDRDISAYIDKGLALKAYMGNPSDKINPNVILAIGHDERQPYRAIRKAIELLSKYTLIKPRWLKQKPHVIDSIGWCSWNALLTEDLSHNRVIGIVRGLRERGVPVKWVIVDDGWQVEEKHSLEKKHMESGIISIRVQKELEPDKNKFPKGFEGLIKELKSIGVEEVGLWHTINIHWGGAFKKLFGVLDVPSIIDHNIGSYIPPGDLDGATEFYEKFYEWIKSKGFDFVKTDNQWYVKFVYTNKPGVLLRNIMIAHQLSAIRNGLWILNSMAMNPENYSYTFYSNVTRVSLDYIPFWGNAAKLHTYWNFYNSILFSFITIPDFDMWMSYDPYAKLYAAASILSGGPVYLTDRIPERSNVELLKRIILPDGRVVKVSEPALPTEDSLFIDPYNEPKLLKVATRLNGTIIIGVFNLYKENTKIKDIIDLSGLKIELDDDRYVLYRVFEETYKIVNPTSKVEIELNNGDVEIIVLAPIKNEKAVIGLKNYLLPPCTIKYTFVNGDYHVESLTNGTLLYYKNNTLTEKSVNKGSVILI